MANVNTLLSSDHTLSVQYNAKNVLDPNATNQPSLASKQYEFNIANRISSILAMHMVGLAGVSCIQQYLPKFDEEEAERTESLINNGRIILFEFLEPKYIEAIVCKALQLKHQELEKFNSQEAQAGFGKLRIAITHKVMARQKDAAQPLPGLTADPAEWLVRDEQSAASWRNNLPPNTTILCAISANETADTLSNLTNRIDSENLKQALTNKDTLKEQLTQLKKQLPNLKKDILSSLETQDQSLGEHYLAKVERALDSIQRDSLLSDLATTLSALKDSTSIFLYPDNLSKYLISALLAYGSYTDINPQIALHKALGLALHILNIPRQVNLFNLKEKLTQTKIKTILDKELKNLPSLLDLATTGKSLDSYPGQDLEKNLKQLLTQVRDIDPLDTAVGESSSSEAVPLLDDWEEELLSAYVKVASTNSHRNKRDELFKMMCHIEWKGKLELFFNPDTQKKKKLSLYERSLKMFENHLKNDNRLTEEEAQVMQDLLEQKPEDLSAEKRNELNNIYLSRSYVFEQDSSISKEWENYIYYNDIYKDPNFLYSLSSALLHLYRHDDDKVLTKLTLSLKGSKQDIVKKNYEVMTFFSLRYGPFLHNLSERLTGRFIVDYKGSTPIASNEAQTTSPEPNPIFNFKYFHEQNSDKQRLNRGKNYTTLDFELTPTYKTKNAQGKDSFEQGKPYQIKWSLNHKCISYFMHQDLEVLAKGIKLSHTSALRCGYFEHNYFTLQGTIQDLNLMDSSTLLSSKQNKLISFFSDDNSDDTNLSKLFNAVYQKLEKEVNLNVPKGPELETVTAALTQLKEHFAHFERSYEECIEAMSTYTMSAQHATKLSLAYSELQYDLMNLSCQLLPGVNNNAVEITRKLLYIILQVGMAYSQTPGIKELSIYAIATPFTVEAIRSFARKLERISNLVEALLNSNETLTIKGRDVYLQSLEQDLNYYDNAEICLVGPTELNIAHSLISQHPTLSDYLNPNNIIQPSELVAVQSVGSYTLYVPPQKIIQDIDGSSLTGSNKNNKKIQQSSKKSTKNTNINSAGDGDCAKIAGISNDSYTNNLVLDKICQQVQTYMQRHIYPLTQCTLLLNRCPSADFAVALYDKLKKKQDTSFAHTHLNLVILCSHIDAAQAVFSFFEAKRFTSRQVLEGSEFIKSISVTILLEHSDNNSDSNFGTLNDYINRLSLQPSGTSNSNNESLNRFAHIGLMVHTFDADSEFKFLKNNYAVPLVNDEVNYQPSLVNMIDYRSSSFNGRFVVNPVMPLGKIALMHSIFYLNIYNPSLFNEAKNDLETALRKAQQIAANESSIHTNSTKALCLSAPSDLRHQENITIPTPLYERTLAHLDHEQQSQVRNVFDQIHRSCDTVFYLDDLLDCNQLKNNNIKVMYFQKLPQNALNFIIATTVNVADKSKHFLHDLMNGLSDDECNNCHKLLTDRSIEISGQLLMRAQLQRRRANELMGMVLTKYVGESMLDRIAKEYRAAAGSTYMTFIALDNYQSIFNNNNHRSDLLGIQIIKNNEGHYLLNLMVLESKFLSKPEFNKSIQQTLATIQRLYDAFKLYDNKHSLERKQWLARIADMLVDNCKTQNLGSANANILGKDQFSSIQQKIRNGEVDILLKGCSVVFVRTPDDEHTYGTKALEANIQPTLDSNDPQFPILQVKFMGEQVTELIKSFVANNGYGSQDVLTTLPEKWELSTITNYCLKTNEPFLLKAQPPLLLPVAPNQAPESTEPTTEITTATMAASSDTQSELPAIKDADRNIEIGRGAASTQDPYSLMKVEVSVAPQVQAEPPTNHQMVPNTSVSQNEPSTIKLTPPDKTLAPERSMWLTTVPRRSYDAWRPQVSELLPCEHYTHNRDRDLLNRRANQIDDMLQEFGLNAWVNRDNIKYGPVITSFTLKLAYGELVKKVESYVKEMPRKLGVASLFFNTDTVTLEVPNKIPHQINLGDVLNSPEFTASQAELPLALGLATDGRPVMSDLVEDGPHLLIAGTTGSGKSVGLNAMLLSLLTQRSPQELRLIIIDPKREFQAYDVMPHMLAPTIKNETDAMDTLRWCVDEMESRYKLITDFSAASDIRLYNQEIKAMQAQGQRARNFFVTEHTEYLEPLPRIVVVIDEFYDLMAQTRLNGRNKNSEFENRLAQLFSKSRAAGIHLILATQSPRAEVIPGLIKSNIPARIAFKVNSSLESKIILDEVGAEKLLSHGDMLYQFKNQATQRAHGAFVKIPSDINAIANAWVERYGYPEYIAQLPGSKSTVAVDSTNFAELLYQAQELKAKTQAQGEVFDERTIRYTLHVDTITARNIMQRLASSAD